MKYRHSCLLALAFLFLAPLAALGADDAYPTGYVAAVLERQFNINPRSLKVKDGIVTIDAADLPRADRPKIVTGNTSGLDRSELGVHLQAVWRTPVTDKTDVSFSAGPSFIRVTQQVATASLRAGTQNIDVTQKSESGTALGINVGFDGSYMFRPQFGAGLFVRYAGGSVDLPAVSNVKVGGFQGGFGLRVRF